MIKIKKYIYIVEDDERNMKFFKKLLGLLKKDHVSYYDSIRGKDGIELIPWKVVDNPEIIIYTALNGSVGLELINSSELPISGKKDIKIKLGQADVIILDIQLPEISGVDICSSLRNTKRFKTSFIIAVTAYAQVGDKETILDAGFNRYITKPIKYEDFLAIIKEELKIL